ncbi:MAG TPA: alkaline phosphatase family protein [Candidatus Eisenbacteria bacterium]
MTRPDTLVVLVIDALGAELAETSGFLAARLPHRQRLRTILGYSSAAIPSLLTGNTPKEHGHWFLYLRAGVGRPSPFRGASFLSKMPARLANRWSVRRRLASWWRRRADIRGYFGLYEVPYRELADMDYVEREDGWGPGTFPHGSFIDDVTSSGLASFVSDWRATDDAKLEAALAREHSAPADVYLMYLTEIDARQHAHGSRGRPVFERLESYRAPLDQLLDSAARRGTTRLVVVSDHGMTDVTTLLDPEPALKATGLHDGRDYRIFIDSTFLRFWCDRPAVADRLVEVLGTTRGLRHVTPEELAREGVDFDDDRYGALHFLADPGVLICPSYMGRTPLMGMHGYTPDDAASDAMLLDETAPGAPLASILNLRDHFRSLLPAGQGRAEPGA